jgi:hypothetical protein
VAKSFPACTDPVQIVHMRAVIPSLVTQARTSDQGQLGRNMKGKKIGEPITGCNSIESMFNEIVNALAKMYVLLQPQNAAEDFIEKILGPLLLSSVDQPAKLEVTTSRAHHDQTFKLLFDRIFQSCAHAVAATKAEEEGNSAEAWSHISTAQYLLGFVEGVVVLEPAVAGIISARSASGGQARLAKLEPLKRKARELASERGYPSKTNAAQSLEKEIIAEAVRLGITFGKQTAWRRIAEWLDGMTFIPSKTTKK